MVPQTIIEERPEQDFEEAECRYGRIRYLSGDAILGRSLRTYGEWAEAEVSLLASLIEFDSVAIDVGAYVGTHTLALARAAGGHCTVHSFEPHPLHFELLRYNVEHNGLANVVLHFEGLSDRPGQLGIAIPNSAAQGNFGGTRLEQATEEAGQLKVSVTTLDRLALDRCDLLKIDAEGMEALILRGSRATLERLQPIAYCECNSAEEGWPVVLFMRELGYSALLNCFAAFNPSNFRNSSENIFGPAREVGLIFVPPQRRAQADRALAGRSTIAPLETLDDLFLGLLRKPQYKHEVLTRTRSAKVFGTDFWLNEAEAASLLARANAAAGIGEQLQNTQRALDATQALAHDRAEELNRLGQRLDATQTALEQTQALAYDRAEELNRLGQRLDATQTALEQTQAIAWGRSRELEQAQVRAHEQSLEIDRLRLELKSVRHPARDREK